ncbi:MAG TPA: hypothetical protein VL202_13915 [Pararhizobium sp.]|uniref:hypothetical protein n=1 Tax=Pararhizobium sp. TaxID=1977563 RepID=UPI002CF9F89B|nr:hypothetical protein [Pararhizobium sp.]HTO32256.1 hypothetical protein [Pararhizobium sp.]
MADQNKTVKLIVLAAFDDGEGNLLPAFDPRQMQDEGRAVRETKAIADKHTAVVAWSRDADPIAGEYGPPTILFQSGPVPEME